MDFEIVNGSVESLVTDCIVVAVADAGKLTPSAQAIDTASAGALKEVIDAGDFDGSHGTTLMLRNLSGVTAKRTLLVGIGKESDRSVAKQQTLIKSVVATVNKMGVKTLTLALDQSSGKDSDIYRDTRLIVEACSAALYQYDTTKSKPATPTKLEHIHLLLDEESTEYGEGALLDGVAIANGVATARELGNLPGNICTPIYLADHAKALADEFDSVSCEILDEKQIESMGMGALYSVGKGSDIPQG